MTRARLSFAVVIALTAAVGAASASAFRIGAYERPAVDPLESGGAPLGELGEMVPDPGGGAPWVVRITATPAGTRCLMVGRTDGQAFGPVNGAGDVVDTGPSFSGSCGVPGDEPLQVALARYPEHVGGGARSVLFGFAEPEVTGVTVLRDGSLAAVAPDDHRTLLVVREGIPDDDTWTVTATLVDGTQRTYIL